MNEQPESMISRRENGRLRDGEQVHHRNVELFWLRMRAAATRRERKVGGKKDKHRRRFKLRHAPDWLQGPGKKGCHGNVTLRMNLVPEASAHSNAFLSPRPPSPSLWSATVPPGRPNIFFLRIRRLRLLYSGKVSFIEELAFSTPLRG